ncbi:P-loop containing nucleoside triphosphate hydrolase protein [Dipodascopsis tothii]|uniref:P-loop containing nucleoside triphosphate hydrolase protein n=1 Tax=Dipodascopsis tothii TaxID=44089 RepID=UPI0034CDC0FE
MATTLIDAVVEHVRRVAGEVSGRPAVIGLQGLQGIGKTTLTTALAELASPRVLVFSIDDLYLDQTGLAAVRERHAGNGLYVNRGAAGTHEVARLVAILEDVRAGRPTEIPQYDKSLHGGAGDRLPRSAWRRVDGPYDAVVLEGWNVGFRAVGAAAAEAAWAAAPADSALRRFTAADVVAADAELAAYEAVWQAFDGFVQLDAEDVGYVYAWRLQQEQALRARTGRGMTDEQVARFVDTYMPAYALYQAAVRRGLWTDRPGRQLRVVVGRDRRVVGVTRI